MGSVRGAKGTKCLRTRPPSSGEEPAIFCPFSRRAVALGLCADECAVTAEWRCAAVTAPLRRLRAEFVAARDIFRWLAVMDSARDGLRSHRLLSALNLSLSSFLDFIFL